MDKIQKDIVQKHVTELSKIHIDIKPDLDGDRAYEKILTTALNDVYERARREERRLLERGFGNSA